MADDPTRNGTRARRTAGRVARLFRAESQSREELRAYGRRLRAETQRRSHAGWSPPAGRCDPVEHLLAFSVDLLPDLVPLRFGRMAGSPLAYFRGAGVVMVADLAETPSNGVYVQACGDAHLLGFAVFPARTRTLVCDILDFNETQPAPWEWDVKRLATSFVVAARDVGLQEEAARGAAEAVVRHYRGTIAALSTETSFGIWAGHLRVDDLLAALRDPARGKAKGNRRPADEGPFRATSFSVDGLVTQADGHPTIGHRPPYVTPSTEQQHMKLQRLYDEYRRTLPNDSRHLLTQYRLADSAGAVTSASSAGDEMGLLLLEGRGDGDHLFLLARRARRSILAAHAGSTDYVGDAQRVIEGQRLTQALADPFLGRPKEGDEWYLRHLRDPAVRLEPQPQTDWFASAARICGATLARAHARSVDPAVISGYLGGSDRFDTAITAFAAAYAEQNERDYEAFVQAANSGRVPTVASR